jgi:hypothetical protein
MIDEQVRRQHVERLEPAPHVTEYLLQVLQHARGELVDQEGALRLEHVAGLAQDALAQRRGDGAERNARDDVVGARVTEASQDLLHRHGGSLHHAQPRVRDRVLQVADEIRVHLDGDKRRVAAHAAQHLGRDAADARTVLDDHAGARPVDGLQELLDEEPRARHDRAEHARVAEEVTREQQGVAVRPG